MDLEANNETWITEDSIMLNESIDQNLSSINLTNNETRNLRYINVSLELPIEYAQPMLGYILPILLVVTMTANTLIVVVLSKRHMRTPTNAVLMAMALSDMLTLLFPAPWYFYMFTLGNYWKPLFPIEACYAWSIMHEILPSLFHTASIWLTLALAVQRYIYVCHAPIARTWCTMPRVMKGIAWIYVFASIHQSTRIVDRVYSPMVIEWEGHPTLVCQVTLASWVDFVTQDVYFNIYFWFRVLFVHTIPCVALVALNVLLFRAMRRAQKRREKLFSESKGTNCKQPTTNNECRKLRDSNCTTLMLIAVVTAFLAVEIPLAVVTLLHIITVSFGVKVLNYGVANRLILLTNFFIILSYPINFAIYCGMSRQFRETFKELFVKGVPTSGGGRRNGSSRYSLVNGPRTCSTNETVL